MRFSPIFIFFFLLQSFAFSQTFNFNNDSTIYKIGKYAYFLEDSEDSFHIEDVQKKPFKKNYQDVLNFQLTKSSYWIKFTVKNNTSENLLLEVDHPTIDFIEIYMPSDNGGYKKIVQSEKYNFKHRPYSYQSILFDLNVNKLQTKIFYLKVKASEQFLVPITIGAKNKILQNNTVKDLIFGIYAGIMLVMIVYNLFVFFTVKDNSYLYYVAYIIFVALTQVTLQGYGFRFLWPNVPQFNNYSTVIIPFLNGITALEFFKHFLNIKNISARIYRITNSIEIFYCVAAVLCMLGYFVYAQLAVQIAATIASVFVICSAVILSKTFRAARFFLLAWSIFLFSVLIFVMRNFNIVPYNLFTYYALQIGSALEVTLLSLALADKINIYRNDNELAQKRALNASLENQRLISDQNVVLEKKVKERTEELENTNSTLNVTLNNLRDTQSQLVDSEKMAALGQLTAGIAHEINNPINFVTSNIKPLELDINDLKEVITKYESIDLESDIKSQLNEIELFKKQLDLNFVNNEISSLLSGISEGAKRTAEIIRSLRNFSRLDESDTKPVDLNEGLISTLVLVRNTLPDNLTLVKELGNLPLIECMPGKINQVFMNLISNAIQAIKTKPIPANEEFLTIKSWFEDDHVIISIKDTGTGMTDDIKQRIFEPFFTTKEIGEGTGLGLSIVFSIIDKHKGHIKVTSKLGEGTEFLISLPLITS